MPTLAVFSVKKFRFVAGEYWTYGGFGDYVRSLLPHFDRVILAVHPLEADAVPAGWYRLKDPKLEYHWLPYYEGEHQCLARLPEMFLRCEQPARRADIVNVRLPDYTGVCGGYWARRANKPVFVSLVADWHSRVRNPVTGLHGVLKLGFQAHMALYCWFEKRICSRELVFAQGRHLEEVYPDNPRLHLCVSSSHYRRDLVRECRTELSPGVCRLLAVGRFGRIKGHADLIRALRILRDRDSERRYELTIAGEGHLDGQYRALAGELDVQDQLRLPGQLGRSQVFSLYDEADVFCLPSYSEGTPKVVLEAMARGTPVVATNVGGVPMVVRDGRTGLLVPPHQPEALAEAILRMVRDDQLRRRCAEEALSVAREHTVEREWGRMMKTVRAHFPEVWGG